MQIMDTNIFFKKNIDRYSGSYNKKKSQVFIFFSFLFGPAENLDPAVNLQSILRDSVDSNLPHYWKTLIIYYNTPNQTKLQPFLGGG